MNRGVFLRGAVRSGAIGGVVIVYLCLVGMIEKFETLEVVGSVITFDWVLMLGTLVPDRVRRRPVPGDRRPAGDRRPDRRDDVGGGERAR